jgi:hypothetical protein
MSVDFLYCCLVGLFGGKLKIRKRNFIFFGLTECSIN